METSQLHTSHRPVAVKITLNSSVAAAALLVIASAFPQEHKPDPKFQIYLCFGQSNMEAGARPEEQDRGDVDPRFQMLTAVDMPRLDRNKGHWYLATPPLNRQENNMGPVDWFGRNMVANLPQDYRVGVINVSVAGARIELWEKDAYTNYLEPAASWMKNICKQYDGNPYQRLVDMARIAQQHGVIKGILLHQGESNPNDPQWCHKVKGIYENLMKDLHLQPEEVPLLAGELVSVEEKGRCAAFNTNVLANLPNVLPNSHIVSSKGFPREDEVRSHHRPSGLGPRDRKIVQLAISGPSGRSSIARFFSHTSISLPASRQKRWTVNLWRQYRPGRAERPVPEPGAPRALWRA